MRSLRPREPAPFSWAANRFAAPALPTRATPLATRATPPRRRAPAESSRGPGRVVPAMKLTRKMVLSRAKASELHSVRKLNCW